MKNNNENINENNIKPIGLLQSILIFGIISVIFFLETHFLIPFLTKQTGLETIIFWFIVAALGMFLPLLVLAYIMLKREGRAIGKDTWKNRMRFRKMDKGDWLWCIGSFIAIGILSFAIMKGLEAILGKVDNQPPFMAFEPLTPGRYWILLLWFPYWLFNIMGEEILWRGVILPGQETVFKKNTWLIHGACWGIFHIAFGWQLLLTLLPLLFIQSYAVQRRKNSWIGVVLHAGINGPSFIAISFGLL